MGYNGPRCVEFVELFPRSSDHEKDKAVVTFHGNPEVVEVKELCQKRSDCYVAAAIAKQTEASRLSALAAEYLKEATGTQTD